ncbi:uncharacterized protein PHACADRAFT_197375 [Phanerochaete carnosa HHB-10118-sp]|uniref:dUTPase-like domain-containing protein n=1 Tax=Phanerochaete carnosa (strain HHB-10118-sp) TaxID=650164 RepID=K5W226_PHACS|nr:uncharacterized protein PHACADRAFT_197375 [Phanerochaete carnosa HHB-10118-sp]EKM52939.1 hypothetical protein PHACADRAFT_197375 [Phanerochaete carnosa HHB-10118-sp]
MRAPHGTYARIAPRSGLAVKGIDIGAGVVDRDYTGEKLRKDGYGNTVNDSYPSWKIRSIVRWDPTEELDKYLPTLRQAFNPPADRKDLHPLNEYRPTAYRLPYGHEVTLAARLENSILLDLDRALREMARAGHFPQTHVPVCTDVGANGFCRPSTKLKAAGKKFESDRCAKELDKQDDLTCVNRCPGDIKCAYKFQGSWWDYQNERDVGYKSLWEEYRNVVAQIRHYMVDVGHRDPKEKEAERSGGKVEVPYFGARYGYILTEQEVVLIKRVQDTQGFNTLHATDGIPLRTVRGQRMNGMVALLFIHLLAASIHEWWIENGRNDH